MQPLRTIGGVIEQRGVESSAVTTGDQIRASETHYPGVFPGEPRIAVLVVLPVEASQTARAELLLCLEAAGYDVWAAPIGRAAVELAEQAPLDMILLDLDGRYEISPEVMVSGFRVLHLLGRLTRERSVAVVVLTGMDFAEVEGPVRANADDFINKPIEPAQLIQRLRGALERLRRCSQRRVAAAAPAWQAM